MPSPPVQIPGRPAPSRLRQTINIAINSRHIGLPPNAPLDAFQPRQTRLRASLNHAKSALVHYLVFDSIFHAVHAYAHDTLGNPHGGSLEAFAQDIAQNYPWPHVPLVVQRTVWELSAVGVAGIGIYQGMTYLYHTFAALAIGLFGWQPEEWPPFYDKPWMATSLYELWGKRWHQVSTAKVAVLTAAAIQSRLFRFQHQQLTLRASIHPLGRRAAEVPSPPRHRPPYPRLLPLRPFARSRSPHSYSFP